MAYLSAVRHLQISAGLPSPTTDSWPWLHYVSKGIKKLQNQPQGYASPSQPQSSNSFMEFGFPITMASQFKRPSYCGRRRPPQFQLLQIRGATAILELHPIPSPSTRPGHVFPRESHSVFPLNQDGQKMTH